MELWAWVKEPHEHRTIRSEIYFAIFRAFRETGIQIPFPQRDIHIILRQKQNKVEELKS